jgi:hypothetical protein
MLDSLLVDDKFFQSLFCLKVIIFIVIICGYYYYFLNQFWSPFSLLLRVPGALFPEINLTEREADHLPPTSIEIKNAWNFPSTPQYVFIACCSRTGNVCARIAWSGSSFVLLSPLSSLSSSQLFSQHQQSLDFNVFRCKSGVYARRQVWAFNTCIIYKLVGWCLLTLTKS